MGFAILAIERLTTSNQHKINGNAFRHMTFAAGQSEPLPIRQGGCRGCGFIQAEERALCRWVPTSRGVAKLGQPTVASQTFVSAQFSNRSGTRRAVCPTPAHEPLIIA